MNANSIDEVMHIYSEILYTSSSENEIPVILKGGYEKRILIFLQMNEFEEKESILLTKMLSACKLLEEDYSIIALKNAQQILPTINIQQPETAILFNLSFDTDMMVLNKPLYKPFRFNNIKFLLSDSLTKLGKDDTLKSSLWTNGLKPLFQV